MTAVMNDDASENTFFLGSLYKRANVNFVFQNLSSQKFYEVNYAIFKSGPKPFSFNFFTMSDNNAIVTPAAPVFSLGYTSSIVGPTFVFSYDALDVVRSQVNYASPVIFIARDSSDFMSRRPGVHHTFNMCDLIVFPNRYIKDIFVMKHGDIVGKSIIALPQSAEDYIGIIKYGKEKQESVN